ncbi:MAG: phosphatase PAP2 family protein [Candidatus Pacearchaeota archaeon]|nr:phosphatase PAP2 family protein [Candidatus Pacearchaeota archaeon]
MRKELIIFLVALVVLSVTLIFDASITTFIERLKTPVLNTCLEWIMFVEKDIIFYPIVMGLTLFLLLLMKDKNRIAHYLASLAVVIALTFLLKVAVVRPRPTGSPELMQDSFPSGHTTIVFTSLPFFKKTLQIIWFVISCILVLARVFAGLHYLSDVIAGAMLGYFIPMLISSFMNRLMERNKTKKHKRKKTNRERV